MGSSMEYRTMQSNSLKRKSRHMHAARETSNLITFKEKNHRHCMPGIHPLRRKTPNKQSTNTCISRSYKTFGFDFIISSRPGDAGLIKVYWLFGSGE